jgi:hypothetical protein
MKEAPASLRGQPKRAPVRRGQDLCDDLGRHRWGNHCIRAHGGIDPVHVTHGDPIDVHRLRTIAADVTRLAAAVAGLAGTVQWTAVGRRAVPRDVPELAASVAFHGLCLAVTSKVVGAATFVAGRGTVAAGEPTAGDGTAEAPTSWSDGTARDWCGIGGWAVALVHVSHGSAGRCRWNLRQDDRSVHTSNISLLEDRHSNEGWDSQLGRDPALGSGNIALLCAASTLASSRARAH